MKISSLFAPAAAFMLAAAPCFADTLLADKITVTGTIQQPPPSDGAAAVVIPVTIANVLTLLGLPDDPKTLRYYYDNDNSAIVIAPKGTKTSESVTPLVTLYRTTGGTAGTDFVGGKLRTGSEVFGEKAIILSSASSSVAQSLTSYSFFKSTFGGGRGTATVSILGHGTIGGVDTIISIKTKDSYVY